MADKPAVTPSSPSTTAPTWVKVISIYYYVGAAFALIVAIILFAGAGFLEAALRQFFPAGIALTSGIFVIVGVILIIGAALDFIIGFFLWRLKSWARILAIVFGILGVLGGLFSLPAGIVGVLINGFIAGYLLFAKEAKAAFA